MQRRGGPAEMCLPRWAPEGILFRAGMALKEGTRLLIAELLSQPVWVSQRRFDNAPPPPLPLQPPAEGPARSWMRGAGRWERCHKKTLAGDCRAVKALLSTKGPRSPSSAGALNGAYVI